jgi:hypothetical protein
MAQFALLGFFAGAFTMLVGAALAANLSTLEKASTVRLAPTDSHLTIWVILSDPSMVLKP